MKRVIAYLGFIGVLIANVVMILIAFDKDLSRRSPEELAIWLSAELLAISMVYFYIQKRFWSGENSEAEKLKNESNILKLKLEKTELMKKLESIENK